MMEVQLWCWFSIKSLFKPLIFWGDLQCSQIPHAQGFENSVCQWFQGYDYSCKITAAYVWLLLPEGTFERNISASWP